MSGSQPNAKTVCVKVYLVFGLEMYKDFPAVPLGELALVCLLDLFYVPSTRRWPHMETERLCMGTLFTHTTSVLWIHACILKEWDCLNKVMFLSNGSLLSAHEPQISRSRLHRMMYVLQGLFVCPAPTGHVHVCHSYLPCVGKVVTAHSGRPCRWNAAGSVIDVGY